MSLNSEHAYERGGSVIMKKHSLAGTCGIPREPERIYIRVDTIADDSPTTGPADPQYIHWADGRCWKTESIYCRQEFGRMIFGNLCVRYDICIARQRRTLWWENGRWFVRRGSGIAVSA